MKKINIVLVLFYIFYVNVHLSAQTFLNNNSYAIPDGGFVYSDIIVSGVNSTAIIGNVTININHPYIADLDIYLVDPLGNEFLLAQYQGGTGANYTNTVFTMSASTNITMGTAPFSGSYIPQGGSLNSPANPNGTWELLVYDDYIPDFGNIVNWSITFVAPPCPIYGIHTYPTTGISTITCNDSLVLLPNDSNVAIGPDYPTLFFQFFTHANGTSNSVTIYEDGIVIYPETTMQADHQLTVYTYGAYFGASHDYTIKVCDNSGGSAPMEWIVYDGNGVNYQSGNTPSGCTTYGPWHPSGLVTWTISPPVPGFYYADWGEARLIGEEAGPGTYTLKYYFDNQANIQGLGGYQCSDSASTVITITNPWNASWNNPGTICSTSGILNLNSLIAGNTGGTWSGTGVSGNNFDPSGLSGPVNITYYVGNSSVCDTSVTQSIIVSIPTAEAGTDTAFCIGNSTQLNATGGTSYSWSPSLGLSATDIPNPIANPITTTTYFVTVTGNPGCTAFDSVTVTVNLMPIADAGADTAICSGGSTQFNATGGTTYSWSPSLGLSATDIPNPIANPITTTTYFLTVTGNPGCTAIDSVTVTVNSMLIADAGVDVAICDGSNTQLNASGGVTYSWSPSLGLSATDIPNPIANPITTTTYFVTVTNNLGCTATDDVTVLANTLPFADAGLDVAICLGNNTQLGASGGTIYSWSPSTGLSATDIPNPIANPTVTTTYIVTITDDNGCSATDNVIVTINLLPTANAGSDAAICIGNSTQLSAGGGITYLWSPSTGLSATDISNPMANPTSTTTYTVTVTNSQGCSATDNVTVTVNSLPTANAGSDVAICNGNSTQLFANGGGTYLWSPSTGLSSTNISVPIASPTTTTTYTVTVTNANNCTASDNVIVTVNSLPSAYAGADLSICSGDNAQLNATGGTNYSWSPSVGLSAANISNPIANPTTTTTYTVTVTDANNCTATDGVVISIIPAPIISLSSDPYTFIYVGQIVTYTASPTGYSNYDFYVNNNLVQSGSSNIYQSSTMQNNEVVTVVTDCDSEDSLLIEVKPIPNAFTPYDVNGKNDVFVKGLDLTIFNRWDQQIYQGIDGWDGKHNGKLVSPGTYFYLIKLADFKGEITEFKGPVSVIGN